MGVSEIPLMTPKWYFAVFFLDDYTPELLSFGVMLKKNSNNEKQNPKQNPPTSSCLYPLLTMVFQPGRLVGAQPPNHVPRSVRQ